jgi:hypothetical protein
MKHYILTYQEFTVYHEDGRYYCVDDKGVHEVELVASVEYDVLQEPILPLCDLFPCYVCGEYIHGEGITFAYFKLKD